MPYTNVTSRTDAAALIQESMSRIMLPTLFAESVALNMFRRINVPSSQVRFPVLSALPSAYFVTGDTGQKQTTEMAWDNKYINIEEMAAIVPIPDNVIFDNYLNVETDILPFVRNAMVRLLDAAVFFGTSAPASWPDDVTTAAIAAGNVYERGTATVAEGGIAEDINQLIALMIADGYYPTGFVGNPAVQTLLRSARGSDGQLLTDVNATTNNIWGLPTAYPMPGQWPTGNDAAELFALQRENFIIGVRQDFTVTASNTAVVHDETGAVTFNAFQQDMTLFRVVFRVGWQVSNPLNYNQAVEANRYPAAVLRSPGA